MADYSQYKVNELKDILRERNLSLGGTKSELIRRLEEHDSSAGSAPEAAGSTETAPQKPEDHPSGAEPTSSTVGFDKKEDGDAEQAATTTEANPKSEEEQEKAELSAKSPEPELKDDEYLAKVKQDIESQIHRAKRFGGDSSELEARLKRILKFGVGAVRDAAAKADTSVDKRKNLQRRRGNKKFRRGPKPATA